VTGSAAVVAGIVVLGVGVIAYMLIKSQSENNAVDAVTGLAGDIL
jgi:hypothetical protein